MVPQTPKRGSFEYRLFYLVFVSTHVKLTNNTITDCNLNLPAAIDLILVQQSRITNIHNKINYHL